MKWIIGFIMATLLCGSALAIEMDSCSRKTGLRKWVCEVKNKIGPDFDLIEQSHDNCQKRFNPSQRDGDLDNLGDACDTSCKDKDWDGVKDREDNCVGKYNPSQRDTDDDGKGDACDLNNKDIDWDGVKDSQDNCMFAYNPTQANADGDKCGDPCDACCKNKVYYRMYQLTGTCPGIA